ncbi:hypothetical protein ACXWO4_10720, partial [Streptococcus pyogenes]
LAATALVIDAAKADVVAPLGITATVNPVSDESCQHCVHTKGLSMSEPVIHENSDHSIATASQAVDDTKPIQCSDNSLAEGGS